MSVNPGFGGQSFIPDVLPKVSAVRGDDRPDAAAPFDLEIDGGIAVGTTAAQATAAGARVLVAGNAVFTKPDYADAIAAIRASDAGARTGSQVKAALVGVALVGLARHRVRIHPRRVPGIDGTRALGSGSGPELRRTGCQRVERRAHRAGSPASATHRAHAQARRGGARNRVEQARARRPPRPQALIARVKDHVTRSCPRRPSGTRAASSQLFGFLPTQFDYEAAEYALLQDQLAGYYEPADGTMYMASDLGDEEAERHAGARARARPAGPALGPRRTLEVSAWQGRPLRSRERARRGRRDERDVRRHDRAHGARDRQDRARPARRRVRGADPRGHERGPRRKDAPHVMRTSLVAPYIYGTLFVHALRRHGGWHAVNRAWDDAPTTSEQILHVDKWLAREPPIHVAAPAVRVASARAGRSPTRIRRASSACAWPSRSGWTPKPAADLSAGLGRRPRRAASQRAATRPPSPGDSGTTQARRRTNAPRKALACAGHERSTRPWARPRPPTPPSAATSAPTAGPSPSARVRRRPRVRPRPGERLGRRVDQRGRLRVSRGAGCARSPRRSERVQLADVRGARAA